MGYGQRHSAAVASRLVSWAERAPVEAPLELRATHKDTHTSHKKEKSMMNRLRRSEIHQNEWTTKRVAHSRPDHKSGVNHVRPGP